MTKRIHIIFGDHINTERIAGMLSPMQAVGNVSEGDNARTYAVEVRRTSRTAYLQKQLLNWERLGVLKYEIE